MAEADKLAGANITREQLLQILNEDLVREFQAMIEINQHIDFLNDHSEVMSDPVKTSNTPVQILQTVLENERKMAEQYRERLRQAEAMEEFELCDILRAIIAQQHEIELCAALGHNVPLPNADKNLFGLQ